MIIVKSNIDELIERAAQRALPKIIKVIEKNKLKQKGKEKYLKRIKRGKN